MPTPLKYNPAYHDDWAWSLAIKGATDQDIADAFHVSRRTIIRWRQTYPSFNEACQHGKEVADAKVKRSLYERAVGFEYQEKESVIDVEAGAGPNAHQESRPRYDGADVLAQQPMPG